MLDGYNIPYATFKEPDLNDTITAVSFLLDERYWDRETHNFMGLNLKDKIGISHKGHKTEMDAFEHLPEVISETLTKEYGPNWKDYSIIGDYFEKLSLAT